MPAVDQLTALLEPMVERHKRLMAGEIEPETDVRAQQLVVRVEKADPPAHTDALTAAARAVVVLLADPRSAEGGEWHDEVHAWMTDRIRKVVRRARGIHWRVAEGLPGVTVRVGTAQVRAFPPSLVTELPKELSRLQVAGIELTDPDAADRDNRIPNVTTPTLWLTPEATMTTGKAMAQVGHASMLLAAYSDRDRLAAWADADFPVLVRAATKPEWAELVTRKDAVAVRDAGFTEVEPGTITVLATW
ncbi:peptidyl-tRNA hydrolase [Fodinicola feengrottensis]|uniref:peptidyl-tRNA hydrolase n=1 Tax=Fodinicola feengrottensis TaxID=435914 RepID=A0ABN2GGS9_9ACTN|nr:peptidyl-tRNA hydrolase [Fodinicola feengrottensis]